MYTGTPGSGKSYHVAKDIYFYLSHGRNVIANFDINYGAVPGRRKGNFVHLENGEMSVPYLLSYCADHHERNARGQVREGQTWVIIDECQLIFNCRSWNDRKRMEWCSFFTQHRKYGFDILFVTQVDRLVDRAIRSLVEYEYKHRKVNNYGIFGWLLGLLFLNRPLFCSIEYWYGIGEKLGSSIMLGRTKYFRLYDSYKLFDVPKDGKQPSGA